MRRLLALLLALGLTACWSAPPAPPAPPPPAPPVPVPPAPPAPPEPAPAHVVPYEVAHAIAVGQTRAAVEASIGFAPTIASVQDDGTSLVEWPALGPAGDDRWLDVHFDRAGLVMGYALVPR